MTSRRPLHTTAAAQTAPMNNRGRNQGKTWTNQHDQTFMSLVGCRSPSGCTSRARPWPYAWSINISTWPLVIQHQINKAELRLYDPRSYRRWKDNVRQVDSLRWMRMMTKTSACVEWSHKGVRGKWRCCIWRHQLKGGSDLRSTTQSRTWRLANYSIF